MKFKTLVIFSIFSILFFAGCDSKGEKKEDNSSLNDNQTIFTLNTIDNSTIEIDLKDNKLFLKDSDNKLILVNFFATWCPACKVKIPNLVDLQNDYQNDIIVVGILLEDFKSNEEISKILSEFNINYTITNSPEGFDLAKALGGLKAIPTIFLVDKDGTIFQKYVGIVPNEMLEIDIKKLLEK
ncbi:TlpA family protein disulfide reductase [Aliarcobacter lanthieri]|uniref:TlpA family protein disulfide reductase n=1 Tax=Aliarcobacter lanthieri TaxID=1355374 RepID=UPI003AACFC98